MQKEDSVVAVYDSFDKAAIAVRALQEAKFPLKKVSLLGNSPVEENELRNLISAGDEAEWDAVRGAGVGALIGVLVDVALFAIPGFGPIVLIGAVATGMTGAIVGGIVGAMAGWGVHSDHLEQYEEKIKAGAVILAVHGSPLDVTKAHSILEQTAASEVNVYAPTSEDSPEIVNKAI